MSVTFGDSFANTGQLERRASTTARDRASRSRRDRARTSLAMRFDVRTAHVDLDRDEVVARRREQLRGAPRSRRRVRPRSTRSRARRAARARAGRARSSVDARPCSPTEFSMPAGGHVQPRRAGCPATRTAASDFAVTAPSRVGSHSARDLVAVPERPRRGDDRVREARAARAAPSRSTARSRPTAASARHAHTSSRSWPSRWYSCSERTSGSRSASSAIPAAAASAAATVVTHGDPVRDRGPPDVHAVGPRAAARGAC